MNFDFISFTLILWAGMFAGIGLFYEQLWLGAIICLIAYFVREYQNMKRSKIKVKIIHY